MIRLHAFRRHIRTSWGDETLSLCPAEDGTSNVVPTSQCRALPGTEEASETPCRAQSLRLARARATQAREQGKEGLLRSLSSGHYRLALWPSSKAAASVRPMGRRDRRDGFIRLAFLRPPGHVTPRNKKPNKTMKLTPERFTYVPTSNCN
jgi:hypothetical protein